MVKYIKGFDGLRCFSIILVIITHLGVAQHLEPGSYLKENVFYLFSGTAGVNMFFSISGFLITSLILKELKETGHFNIKFFFIRRFLRLLPPIIPFFIAIFIFMKLGYIRDTTFGLIASIFYLFNFVPKAKLFWSAELSSTWSLAVEEQFYILFAFVFKFFKTNKSRICIIYILLIVCILSSYIFPLIHLNIKGIEYKLTEVFYTERWTIPAIGPILIGSLFAILYFKNWKDIQNQFKKSSFGVLSLLIFISPLYLHEIFMPLIHLFHGLGTVFILLWITSNQNSLVVKSLEWKPIKYIGTISYGLYIWQAFFIRTGPDMTPKIGLHDYPQNLILTFIVAILSYDFFEKKVLRLKHKFQPNLLSSK